MIVCLASMELLLFKLAGLGASVVVLIFGMRYRREMEKNEVE